MAGITCRDCGQPEHQGECERPDVSKLQARIKELEEEAEINDAVINMHWEADMRAVKLWREEHPERKMILPDQTNLVTWLLGQMELIPTKDEAIKAKDYLIRTHKPSTNYTHSILNKCTLCNFIAKLQKIIDKKG